MNHNYGEHQISHNTKTVNYHYRPTFSDLTKDLINFLPKIQNQEHQLITEQHNESYGSEQDIAYKEIQLVKKAKCIGSFNFSPWLRLKPKKCGA